MVEPLDVVVRASGRGSVERTCDGNTHCQAQILSACGYLTAKAWQIHAAKTSRQILFLQGACLLQLRLQRADRVFGQYRDAILIALAFANHDFAPGKFNILHAQAQRLHQPHARAIQKLGNQICGSIHMHEQGAHFGRRQHHRQAPRPLGLNRLIQPGQVDLQHLFVQIQQRRLGVVLRGGLHLPVYRQMAQEGLYLRRAHVLRVALAIEQDEAAHPVHVGLLGTDAVVPRAQVGAQAA